MKDSIKRFIDVNIPVTNCNLKCHYCYVSQIKERDSKPIRFKYPPETIVKGLSRERLDGICHFNLCGMGETLIPDEIISIVRGLLEEGHYVIIVTNGTLTKRFEQFCAFPENLRKHLGFKFSYHYLEQHRLHLTEVFFSNVRMVWDAGISFTIELTPSDELEPLIDDVIEEVNHYCGANCHLTIPRDEINGTSLLLSKHNFCDWYKIWSVFESPMLDFKKELFYKKIQDYCYAGLWSGLLDLETGIMRPCYYQRFDFGDIFKDIKKPIPFTPVAKCKAPYCHNGHAFLSLGLVPSMKTPNYAEMRNRETTFNKNWYSDEMSEFLSHKLVERNQILNRRDKVKYKSKRSLLKIKYYITHGFKKIFKKK